VLALTSGHGRLTLNKKAQEGGIASDYHIANILGLHWNTRTDQLSLTPRVNITLDQLLITKRQVLKDTCIRAKIFMQMLWQLHVNWDEPLVTSLQEEWNTILADLQQLSSLTIDRHYFQAFNTEGIQLQVFADANKKAYGAVAFFTSDDRTTLVTAKNRVAPLRTLTLPKLELMAAVITYRVARFIIDVLQIQDIPIYCWGDSQIVLYWLKNSKDLPLFMRRRVLEIKEGIPEATLNCCPTVDNPADMLTGGISSQLLSSPSNLWWKGPPWLMTPTAWPQWQPEPAIELHAAAAIAEEFVPQPHTHPVGGLHTVINIADYSTLNRLLAVTAYTYRYINNLHKSRPKLGGPLTATEISPAHTR